MGMNYGNITKATFKADIKRKQAFFNRCKRRFKVAITPGEKQFLKAEVGRIVTELKQCGKKWQNFGFGTFGWITKNFTVTNFNTVRTHCISKSAVCKTGYGKSSIRGVSKRSMGTRSKSRVNNNTRSKAVRRSYVAW